MKRPASRYVLVLSFGAADDGQAVRLAQAWADTCAAEYGTRFEGVFRRSDGLTLSLGDIGATP